MANPPLSCEQFIERLAATGLFPGDELNRVLASLPGPAADGSALAAQLITAGTLTTFQAQAVLAGRTDELVLGHYEVLEQLGAGGMGAVYKARHRRMKRVVALKVLSRACAGDTSFVQRFQREVEVVAQLAHPNIVMAYDAGEARLGPFLVMEYVNGKDLARLVHASGPLSVAAAVDVILQAARGLAYAHGQGIVHRDVKPANLLRDVHGVVKVADLGLARLNADHGAEALTGSGSLTQTGSIVGTVDFMAPEQAFDSTTIDQRADIYALGCTLYFVLTGQPPFAAATPIATLLRHRDAPVPALTAACPDVVPTLEEVYRRMLAKLPADRWQTMTEVVQMLEAAEALLSGGATVIRPTVPLAPPQAAPSTCAPSQHDTQLEMPSGPVLLVEPSRVQATIVRGYLKELGVGRVETVATGAAVLAAVRAGRPQLIISTMCLPDLTGTELARQVRALPGGAETGFVLIASEADEQAEAALRALPAAVLLHKPFDRPHLEQAIRQVRARPSAKKPRGQLKVLLVDDSPTTRLVVRQLLLKLGVGQVMEVSSGTAALAALEHEAFDLVLTDYRMAGMDGKELAQRVRADRAVPVVVMTATADPGLEPELRQAGVAAVCGKAALAETLGGLLDGLRGVVASG